LVLERASNNAESWIHGFMRSLLFNTASWFRTGGSATLSLRALSIRIVLADQIVRWADFRAHQHSLPLYRFIL
jgi:hypothetical protein